LAPDGAQYSQNNKLLQQDTINISQNEIGIVGSWFVFFLGVPDEDLILCHILLCIKMMPRVQRAQDEYTDAYKKSQAPHRSDLVLIVFADGER